LANALSIEWHGCDGSVWHVCGDNIEEEGVFLLPNIAAMIDAPITTQWVKGPFGEKYEGFQVQNRKPVLGFRIRGETPADFRDIDSRFRKSWDYENEGFMRVITDDGVRDLYMRLFEQPDAYGGDASLGGGYDPHYLSDSQVVINAACENPFYVGSTITQDHDMSGSGTWTPMIQNDGDQDMWLKYTILSNGNSLQVTLPDYSWGSEEFGRSVEDAARTVPVPKSGGLRAGEHIDVDSDPQEELIVSDLDTNPWARMGGNTLLYPVPRWTDPTPVTISWTGAAAGDKIRVTYTPMYSRPFGSSRDA